MLNRFLIILISLTTSSCYAQVDKSLINNWKSHAIPTNPDTLRRYNNSQNERTVILKDSAVHVIKSRPYYDQSILPFKIEPNKSDKSKMSGKISLLGVEDGYLIGFYRGEWGGYLYWFSKDGKHHYLISDHEIVQFIKRNGIIYAIQGLAHLGMSEGSIIKIEKQSNKWVAQEYLQLPTAPDAIALDANNDFIVITSKSLLKINNDKTIAMLVERGVWYDGLYTNSMIIKDNIVYAGMREGVFKFNLSTGNQEWLLPY
jgi:hypothetical protein